MILRFYVTVLTLFFVSAGCTTQPPQVPSADYQTLKGEYLNSMTFDVEGVVIADPLICKSFAGVGFPGIGGCHLALVPIKMPDDSVYMAIVSSWRRLHPGHKVRGRFVFVEIGPLVRSEMFWP